MKDEYTPHGLALCQKYERANLMRLIRGPKRYEIYHASIMEIHRGRIS